MKFYRIHIRNFCSVLNRNINYNICKKLSINDKVTKDISGASIKIFVGDLVRRFNGKQLALSLNILSKKINISSLVSLIDKMYQRSDNNSRVWPKSCNNFNNKFDSVNNNIISSSISNIRISNTNRISDNSSEINCKNKSSKIDEVNYRKLYERLTTLVRLLHKQAVDTLNSNSLTPQGFSIILNAYTKILPSITLLFKYCYHIPHTHHTLHAGIWADDVIDLVCSRHLLTIWGSIVSELGASETSTSLTFGVCDSNILYEINIKELMADLMCGIHKCKAANSAQLTLESQPRAGQMAHISEQHVRRDIANSHLAHSSRLLGVYAFNDQDLSLVANALSKCGVHDTNFFGHVLKNFHLKCKRHPWEGRDGACDRCASVININYVV